MKKEGIERKKGRGRKYKDPELEHKILNWLTPVKPHNTKEGRVEKDGSIQLSMFQLDDPLLESLRDRLKAVDLNNLTPLQAFDLLRAMKEELGI